MSLFPMEKIAVDHLDDQALVKLGFSQFWGYLPGRMIMGGLRGLGHLGMGTARLAGKGMWGSAKLFGRTAQMAGNAVVNHPGMAMGVGLPAAFAVFMLVLLFSMAVFTLLRSSKFMRGLGPRPPFSRKPLIPFILYCLNQLYTASFQYPTNFAISSVLMPSAFIRTALQRIRKRWEEPKRSPSSSSKYRASLYVNFFAFLKYISPFSMEYLRDAKSM